MRGILPPPDPTGKPLRFRSQKPRWASGADGVSGQVNSAHNAVSGINTTTGSGNGVYGETSGDTCGYAAGFFDATNSGSCANGVAGVVAGNGTGVYARTFGGYGLYAIDQGSSASAYAIYGTSTEGIGVYGISADNYAIYGTTSGGLGYAAIFGTSSTADADGVYGYTTGSNSVGVFAQCSGGSGCLALYAGGNIEYTGSLTHVSDERLKSDIKPLKGSIEQLLRLRGVSFCWKDPSKHGDATEIQRGFVAQEYERVFPEWVKTDREGFKTIDTTGLDAMEVESIRTLKMQSDALSERVKELESGRRPMVSGFDLNGLGFGVGGLAIGGGLVLTQRRKREAAAKSL
jgi:hypothetical protein